MGVPDGDAGSADAARPAPRNRVCFLGDALHTYYFGGLLSGLASAAEAAGWTVIAVQTANPGSTTVSGDQRPRGVFSIPIAHDAADAFVVALDAVPDAFLATLRATGKPVIVVGPRANPHDCPTVTIDNERGVRSAIEHLLAHGHTEIGFVGHRSVADAIERYAIYSDAMTAAGLTVHPAIAAPGATADGHYESGYAAGVVFTERGESCTAVIANTDLEALGFMRALRAAGRSIPDDVAVIGFDDMELAAVSEPPLTTSAIAFAHHGIKAFELIEQAIAGATVASGPHPVPVSLVVRTSCGCAPRNLDASLVADADADVSAEERFVARFSRIVSDSAPDLADDAAVVGARLVAACGEALRDRGTQASLEDIAVDMAALCTSDRAVKATISALRLLAADLIAQTPDAAGDADAVGQVHTVATAVAVGVVRAAAQVQAEGYLQMRNVLQKQSGVGAEMLRRRLVNPRSLAWLSDTEAHAGCFGVWTDGGSDLTTIADVYDVRRSGLLESVVGTTYAIEQFPPRELYDVAQLSQDTIIFVVPVNSDERSWGLLAFTGRFELSIGLAFEGVGHLATLMTVALDHERAMQIVTNKTGELEQALAAGDELLENLRLSEERYALAAEAANDGLWDWDVTTQNVYYSSRWKALLGYSDGEVGSGPTEWLHRVHEQDLPHLNELLGALMSGRERTIESEHRVRAANGTYRWMLVRARSVRTEAGEVRRIVGSMTDVTERRGLQDQLRHDALYDALTGLPNRTLYLDRISQAIKFAKRRSDYHFAVLFVDLDGFKNVNDTLGHAAGDELLVAVADRLRASLRANDTAARFGGDEFVVLVNDVRDLADLQVVADRLQVAISAPYHTHGTVLTITAAIGIAAMSSVYAAVDDLIRDADAAMYAAKKAGKGRTVTFDLEMHEASTKRLHLQVDLQQALAEGGLELHYQPVVTLREHGEVRDVEALIRWKHPTLGWVAPDAFLPVAEEAGLMPEIGHWTVREACRQMAVWSAQGVRDIAVAVNVSNSQFWDAQLLPQVLEALHANGCTPERLVLEITEGVIMSNPGAANAIMSELREIGVRLHLDDFGTGYSSLSVLHQFPIDALKIDRSFIARMHVDSRSTELVNIILAMGRNVGVDVIAEGIETADQLEQLVSLGCPKAQGYYFSRPRAGSEITEELLERAGEMHRPAVVS